MQIKILEKDQNKKNLKSILKIYFKLETNNFKINNYNMNNIKKIYNKLIKIYNKYKFNKINNNNNN